MLAARVCCSRCFVLGILCPVPSRTKLGVMYLAGYGIKRHLDIALQSAYKSSHSLRLGRDATTLTALATVTLISLPLLLLCAVLCCVWCRLFTESSEEGDRDAQAHLAAMHLQGVGTPKNLAKAVELYTNAAERGHVRAQSALAVRDTQHIAFIR